MPSRKPIMLASWILQQLHTPPDSEDRWLEHKSGNVNVNLLGEILVAYCPSVTADSWSSYFYLIV